MSDDESKTITLPMIYAAVLDFRSDVLSLLEEQDRQHGSEIADMLAAIGALTRKLDESNRKAETFTGIAEKCFDQLAVVNAMAAELAVNVTRHEAEIVLLKHPAKPTLPPSSNGTDG